MLPGIGLAVSGVGAIANMIGARQQAKLQREQLDQDKRLVGVHATQMDPFAQQKQRQKQAILGQLVNLIQPSTRQGNQLSGGLRDLPSMLKGASPFFGPEAMAGAEKGFHDTIRGASPSYTPGPRTALGYDAGVGPQAPPPPTGPGWGNLIKRGIAKGKNSGF